MKSEKLKLIYLIALWACTTGGPSEVGDSGSEVERYFVNEDCRPFSPSLCFSADLEKFAYINSCANDVLRRNIPANDTHLDRSWINVDTDDLDDNLWEFHGRLYGRVAKKHPHYPMLLCLYFPYPSGEFVLCSGETAIALNTKGLHVLNFVTGEQECYPKYTNDDYSIFISTCKGDYALHEPFFLAQQDRKGVFVVDKKGKGFYGLPELLRQDRTICRLELKVFPYRLDNCTLDEISPYGKLVPLPRLNPDNVLDRNTGRCLRPCPDAVVSIKDYFPLERKSVRIGGTSFPKLCLDFLNDYPKCIITENGYRPIFLGQNKWKLSFVKHEHHRYAHALHAGTYVLAEESILDYEKDFTAIMNLVKLDEAKQIEELKMYKKHSYSYLEGKWNYIFHLCSYGHFKIPEGTKEWRSRITYEEYRRFWDPNNRNFIESFGWLIDTVLEAPDHQFRDIVLNASFKLAHLLDIYYREVLNDKKVPRDLVEALLESVKINLGQEKYDLCARYRYRAKQSLGGEVATTTGTSGSPASEPVLGTDTTRGSTGAPANPLPSGTAEAAETTSTSATLEKQRDAISGTADHEEENADGNLSEKSDSADSEDVSDTSSNEGSEEGSEEEYSPSDSGEELVQGAMESEATSHQDCVAETTGSQVDDVSPGDALPEPVSDQASGPAQEDASDHNPDSGAEESAHSEASGWEEIPGQASRDQQTKNDGTTQAIEEAWGWIKGKIPRLF